MRAAHARAVEEEPATGSREEATFSEARNSQPDNRRIHPRFAVDLDVSLSSDHNFYAGFAENISSGGLFIATHVQKPVGEKMDVSVTLPDGGDPIRCVGEVRWVRVYSEQSNVPPGLGLKFLGLSAADIARIETFLTNREPLFYDDD
ncbi:MAG TPA: TIGR02266 family protein [Polyangiaceae bacterium]|nr:TIGR02266 family protein [Polyangiaceae bacterium]